MNQRTYEILAKWVAKQHNLTISWSSDPITPSADVKNKIIYLPLNIKKENVFGALALLMHEAGHLAHTTKLPLEELAKTKEEHEVLNAIEDVRIDLKNFDLLPNIEDFYEKFVEQNSKEYPKGEDLKKISLYRKVMSNAIMECEGFSKYKIKDQEAIDFEKKHDVVADMRQAVYDLNRSNWSGAYKIIQKLVKLFNLPKTPLAKKGEEQGQGQGEGKGKGKLVHGQVDFTKGNPTDELLKKHNAFAQGQGSGDGTSVSQMTPIAVKEATKRKFIELLNVKVPKMIDDGKDLDTDNLTAFLTGDLDDLFKEEIVMRTKKSKISFVIDGSGSMTSELMDGKRRNSVVAGCVEELTKILDEVINLEGINVDYDLAGFHGAFIPFKKETWKTEYLSMNGGTDLLNAFTQAQERMLKDYDIEGKKLIILFTDGEVGGSEIEDIQKAILRHNEDVRCMIIGVGASPTGKIIDVIGDYNILMAECADTILIEAISEML